MVEADLAVRASVSNGSSQSVGEQTGMNDQLFDLLGDDGEIYGPYRVAELQKLSDVNRADRQSQIRESGTENQWRSMETILTIQETSSDSLDRQNSDVLVTGDTADGLYDLIGAKLLTVMLFNDI